MSELLTSTPNPPDSTHCGLQPLAAGREAVGEVPMQWRDIASAPKKAPMRKASRRSTHRICYEEQAAFRAAVLAAIKPPMDIEGERNG